MLDLETLIKKTAQNPDLIEVQCCLEDDKPLQIPEDYRLVVKRLTHRWGIMMVDDRIIIHKSLRYAALSALHFGQPGMNKMCNDATIYWWQNMQADIEKKAKTCSTCLNAGKILKSHIPNTEKSKTDQPKNPREEIQIDFTGNLNSKNLNCSRFILIALDKNSRRPAARIFNNADHDTVLTFLWDFIKFYGVPRTIKSDKCSAFISKKYNNFCIEYNIIRKYGTSNLYPGTGWVKRTIQSRKILIKGNLEEK